MSVHSGLTPTNTATRPPLDPCTSDTGSIYILSHHTAPIAQFDKAVKADDAVTPVNLWNDHIWEAALHLKSSYDHFCSYAIHRKGILCPLDVLHSFFLGLWRCRVTRSLMSYLRNTHGVHWLSNSKAQDYLAIGRDCIWRVSEADWWNWSKGSTLFFWQRPASVQELVKFGHPL